MTLDELYVSTADLLLELQNRVKIMKDELVKTTTANQELQQQLAQAQAEIKRLGEIDDD